MSSSSALTQLPEQDHYHAEGNPQNRYERRVLPARHAYPYVSISGNAKVQLGDQFLQNELQETNESASSPHEYNEKAGIDHLDAVLAIIDFVDYATRLSKSPDNSNRVVRSVVIEEADICAARDSITKHCSKLSKISRNGIVEPDGSGSDILLGAIEQAFGIAEELGFVLQELEYKSGQKEYRSFQEAVVEIWKRGDVHAAHHVLLESSISAMLGYLVSKRPEVRRSVRSARKNTTLARFLDFSSDGLFESHSDKLQALSKALSPGWLSYRTPLALKSAAESWSYEHRDLMQNYTSWVLSEVEIEYDLRFRWQLLQTLSFDEINRRYEGISPAQKLTYEWLFHSDRASQLVGDSFATWLTSTTPKSRIYWISGKPGSGKSTLMRFLTDDPRTLTLSHHWSEGRQIILARCFFWDPGTSRQKSQTGLLQTLLFQLLKQHSSISGHELFPRRWQSLELGGDGKFPWSLEELRDAIFRCLQIVTNTKNVYVFVDGLDEYSGTDEDRSEVCCLLRDLAANTRVKICASSRPWNVYRDSFAGDPSLRLENLNRTDIWKFVEQAMTRNKLSKPFAETEPSQQVHNLIETIVDRAQGVFLWARLVVRSLLTGLRDGDDTQEMTKRLDDIPADLEQYFSQMLGKLKTEYREQASQIFNMALEGAMPLMSYYFIHKAHRDVHFEVKPLTAEDIRVREGLWDRRINARCMDLLESRPGAGRSLRMVDFMHRTARDFVASIQTQQLLNSWRQDIVSKDLLLFKSHVAMLQSCDVERPWMGLRKQAEYLEKILRLSHSLSGNPSSAQAVQAVLDAAQTRLDSLLVGLSGSTMMTSSKQYADDEMLTPEIPDFLAFVISERLDEYACWQLSRWTKSDLQHRTGRPLLDCALSPATINIGASLGIRSIARLLQLGASPDQMWRGASVFARFLQRLQDEEMGAPISECFEVAKMLISSGSTRAILTDQRVFDGFYGVAIRHVYEPKEVFAKVFDEDQQRCLSDLLDSSKPPERMIAATRYPPQEHVGGFAHIHAPMLQYETGRDIELKPDPTDETAPKRTSRTAPQRRRFRSILCC